MLPPKLFLGMANAGGVEVRAGRFKFKLGAPALKALWELAGRINAAAAGHNNRMNAPDRRHDGPHV